MRFFEILLLVVAIGLPVLSHYPIFKNHLPKWAAGTLILLAAHAIFEGIRWQMIPCYILLLLIILLTRKSAFFAGKWYRKAGNGLLWTVLFSLGTILPTILPVPKLPSPTGSYQIGSQQIHVQTEQENIFTEDTNDKRELMVKAWYPAILNGEDKEQYIPRAERIGFATKYGLPKSALSYLTQTKTHTYQSTKVADGTFPVLIFSHGHFSKASGYYGILEDIVSHGYIVLAINHTGESTGVEFPDGRMVFYDIEFDRTNNNQEMADMAWAADQGYKNATNEVEKFAAIENTLRNYVAVDITKRWSQDIQSVVDLIPKWNSDSFLKDHLSTEQVGVFGHSQGGSAAGQALVDDSRIKCGINIDGIAWGNMIDTFMTKPFSLLTADWPDAHPDFNKFAYKNGGTSEFYKAKILGTAHSNYMDIPLIVNLSFINEAGPIDPYRAYEITNDWTVSFFDQYLKGEGNKLENVYQKYPALEPIE